MSEIFLDLDGVMFNLNQALWEKIVDYNLRYNVLNGELTHKAYTRTNDAAKFLSMEQSDFWKNVVGDVVNFWTDLEPYSWAQQLLDFCNMVGNKVRFLTSPVDCLPSSYKGKKLLCDKFFPYVKLITCSPEDKHLLSDTGRILIDDSDKNVQDWNKRKGKAILFPQLWNTGKFLTNNSLLYVAHQLGQYASKEK